MFSEQSRPRQLQQNRMQATRFAHIGELREAVRRVEDVKGPAARRSGNERIKERRQREREREDGFRNRICRGPSFRPRITPSRARRAQTVEIPEEETVARVDPSFLSPLRKITFPIQIVIACKTSLARDTSAHISHCSPQLAPPTDITRLLFRIFACMMCAIHENKYIQGVSK